MQIVSSLIFVVRLETHPSTYFSSLVSPCMKDILSLALLDHRLTRSKLSIVHAIPMKALFFKVSSEDKRIANCASVPLKWALEMLPVVQRVLCDNVYWDLRRQYRHLLTLMSYIDTRQLDKRFVWCTKLVYNYVMFNIRPILLHQWQQYRQQHLSHVKLPVLAVWQWVDWEETRL